MNPDDLFSGDESSRSSSSSTTAALDPFSAIAGADDPGGLPMGLSLEDVHPFLCGRSISAFLLGYGIVFAALATGVVGYLVEPSLIPVSLTLWTTLGTLFMATLEGRAPSNEKLEFLVKHPGYFQLGAAIGLKVGLIVVATLAMIGSFLGVLEFGTIELANLIDLGLEL